MTQVKGSVAKDEVVEMQRLRLKAKGKGARRRVRAGKA